MDAAAMAATRIQRVNILASPAALGVANKRKLSQPALLSTQLEMLTLAACGKSSCKSFSSHKRIPNYRGNTPFIIQCSTKPGLDSNNATNKNSAFELDSNSTIQQLTALTPDQTLKSTCFQGLVFSLGPKNSWDSGELGSPIVKRYLGDNEERWYMWYHGRSDANTADSIGLAVSSNGIHWSRGEDHVKSCGDAGLVMDCTRNWWAFDTGSIRPSEVLIMSSSMYSSVYWLYYTGYSSEEVHLSVVPNRVSESLDKGNCGDKKDEFRASEKYFKSLPGLACSQDGRHWARIEGDHHSGALLDVGPGQEWDSLFIAAPHVVMHSSDDLRMYYHSFDEENRNFAIGVARSRDGIRWVKLGKILGGSKGSFDELGVRNACVVRNQKEGNYVMAYEVVAADGKSSIELAVSQDGLRNWNRVQEIPVLKSSEDDGWDNDGVASPCLVQMEGNIDEWRLYYVGLGHGGWTGIGMAISEGSSLKTFRKWEGLQV